MKVEAKNNLTVLPRPAWGTAPETAARASGASHSLVRAPGQGLVIIGGGPAGLSPLFAAAAVGRLSELLEQGITVVERGEKLGAGALNRYAIASDSTAATFLDVLKGSAEPELRALEHHPAASALRQLGNGEAPLALVAEWLEAASDVLFALISASRHGRVLTNTNAISVQQSHQGGWTARVQHAAYSEEIGARRILLATGAHQPVDRLQREWVAGAPLLPRFGHKLLQSGVVLANGGAEIVAARLRGIRHPRVAIVGGSTSAAATAVMLLRELPQVPFALGSISLLHRKPFRICYESVEEAVAAGDNSFALDDICPLTRRVNRFSGLRLSSRELLMRAQKLGTGPAEPRLQLVQIQEGDTSAARCLEEADLIIAALGYRPLLLPVQDTHGQEVRLHQPTATDWSVVDQHFRLRTQHGNALEGLFASGLAVGPVPDRNLGGELGFRGQVNSLWMWQHNLGLRLLDELLAPVPAVRYRGMAKTLPMLPASSFTRETVAGGLR